MNKFINKIVSRMIHPEQIIALYWALPGGRGVAHYESVRRDAQRLVGRDLTVREELVILLHDIGVGRLDKKHRDDHPGKALELIDNDEVMAPIRPLVDSEMRYAIAAHMADEYKKWGVHPGVHQLLVEADEGCPTWGDKRIEKPAIYWLSERGAKHGLPLTAPKAKVIGHIREVLQKKAQAFESGVQPFTPRFVATFRSEIDKVKEWVTTVTDADIERVILQLAPGYPNFHGFVA